MRFDTILPVTLVYKGLQFTIRIDPEKNFPYSVYYRSEKITQARDYAGIKQAIDKWLLM